MKFPSDMLNGATRAMSEQLDKLKIQRTSIRDQERQLEVF